MTLSASTRVGPYEILSALGAGGMGEVYRARDTKLHRDVAIKVLPELFTKDAERLARFEREAHVLATLNHPNIAAIYGLEDSDGLRALVLELVEGPTLADRIAQGPIAIHEALPIAKQMAEALEAAHERGIIHRDLKPANIKVRPDGTVKILDFGLAKAMEPAGATSAGPSQSPTMTTPAMTHAGVILGTAAYMSPEQARGLEADRTTDIWAFGCVLYEMLVGRPAFAGGSVAEVLSEVLKSEPDWKPLPEEISASVRRLLRRCLKKDRRERLQDIGDARLELLEPDEAVVAGRPPAAHHPLVPWILSGALAVALGAAIVTRPAVPPRAEGVETRLEIATPPTLDANALALSPDGRKLVFSATTERGTQLWLRSLEDFRAVPLPGTDDGRVPFWAPDSQTLGFFADGKIKRLNPDGSIRNLVNVPFGWGAVWGTDGTILYAPTAFSTLLRVAASGSAATRVTTLEPSVFGHTWPHLLPDERHVAFAAGGSPNVAGIYIGDVETGKSSRLLDVSVTQGPRFMAGHLLFTTGGKLVAQPFDMGRLVTTGEAFLVAEGAAGAPTVSQVGALAFRTGSAVNQRQFVWFDRSGGRVAAVGEADPGNPANPTLSPDGKQVAQNRMGDIWTLDLARGLLNRLTTHDAIENFPVWSPDGRRMVFGSSRDGVLNLFVRTLASGVEEPLLVSGQIKDPEDWSRDGRFLLYRSVDPGTGNDLWVLPMDPRGEPFPFARTSFDERAGEFSPNGRYVAYQSDESGRFEVYLQPFPGPGQKTVVSANGGTQVRWRGDGKELFYVAADGRLMAVPVKTRPGESLDVGNPSPLFLTHIGGGLQSINSRQYVVSPDGQRFLMNTMVETAASPIAVILNWSPKRAQTAKP